MAYKRLNPRSAPIPCPEPVSLDEIAREFEEGYQLNFFSFGPREAGKRNIFSFYNFNGLNLRRITYSVVNNEVMRTESNERFRTIEDILDEIQFNNLKLLPMDLFRVLSRREECVGDYRLYPGEFSLVQAKNIFNKLLDIVRENPQVGNADTVLRSYLSYLQSSFGNYSPEPLFGGNVLTGTPDEIENQYRGKLMQIIRSFPEPE